MRAVLTYRLDGDRVIQTEADGETTEFDPLDWGAFTRGSLVVHAVRIPRPFKLGAEICKDGYLVFDDRLKAISALTFGIDYRALSGDPKDPEDAEPGEWEKAAA